MPCCMPCLTRQSEQSSIRALTVRVDIRPSIACDTHTSTCAWKRYTGLSVQPTTPGSSHPPTHLLTTLFVCTCVLCRQLDVSCQRPGLAALPYRLSGLSSLTNLNAMGNALTSLPEDFGRLTGGRHEDLLVGYLLTYFW